MNIPDLTPAQDAAFVTLRKYYNRANPTDQRTKQQLIEAYALKAFEDVVAEADTKLTGEELRNQYKAATPTIQAQVATLLGL